MDSMKPILVTGSHCSGTTWVGRMIAASPSVVYIDEPFNIKHDVGICGAQFDYWFTYVSDQNEQDYYEHIKKTITFRYNLAGKIKTSKHPGTIVGALRDYLRFVKYHSSGVRPLLKDPIAVFSAEWLASRFDMEFVVLIRHPAAFAGSLKVKNWTHPFSHFLEQRLLMNDHLSQFEAEIKRFAEEPHDIVDQAALLWTLIHHMIKKYQKNHPDWIFVRHEDLSRDPLHGFQTLFSMLGLGFSHHLANVIKAHSSPSNSGYISRRTISLQRDSLANIWNWKTRLTKAEIERIKAQVGDTAKEFYSDADW